MPISKDQKDILVMLIAAMVVLALAFGTYFLVNHAKLPWNYSDDPALRALEKLEDNKETLALIDALYSNRDRAFSTKVLPWLDARDDQGFAPFYYAKALHLYNLGKRDAAVGEFFAAGLIARTDVLHCLDNSSERFIAILERPFTQIPEYLKENKGLQITAATLALQAEESVKNRGKPKWLCDKGEKELGLLGFVADAEWEGRRAVARNDFRRRASERNIEPEVYELYDEKIPMLDSADPKEYKDYIDSVTKQDEIYRKLQQEQAPQE